MFCSIYIYSPLVDDFMSAGGASLYAGKPVEDITFLFVCPKCQRGTFTAKHSLTAISTQTHLQCPSCGTRYIHELRLGKKGEITTTTEAEPKGDVELQKIRIQCYIEIDGIIICCKFGPI